MYKLHSRSPELGDTLLDLVILDSHESKENYYVALKISDELKVLGETSEKWYLDNTSDDYQIFTTLVKDVKSLFFKTDKAN